MAKKNGKNNTVNMSKSKAKREARKKAVAKDKRTKPVFKI